MEMSAEIEFHGLEEFKAKLGAVMETYTETAEKHLKRAGNRLKKMAAENTPHGHERDGRKMKPLSKSWKGKITGISTGEIQYELRNTSKVYHLVERGHIQKTPSGRVTGFVQGKHFFDQTAKDFQASGIMEKELEKFMQDVKKKLS